MTHYDCSIVCTGSACSVNIYYSRLHCPYSVLIDGCVWQGKHQFPWKLVCQAAISISRNRKIQTTGCPWMVVANKQYIIRPHIFELLATIDTSYLGILYTACHICLTLFSSVFEMFIVWWSVGLYTNTDLQLLFSSNTDWHPPMHLPTQTQ